MQRVAFLLLLGFIAGCCVQVRAIRDTGEMETEPPVLVEAEATDENGGEFALTETKNAAFAEANAEAGDALAEAKPKEKDSDGDGDEDSKKKKASSELTQPFIVHDMSESEALGTHAQQKIVTPELRQRDPQEPSRGLRPAIVVQDMDADWVATPGKQKFPKGDPKSAVKDPVPLDEREPLQSEQTADSRIEWSTSPSRSELLARTDEAMRKLNAEYASTHARLREMDKIRKRLKRVFREATQTKDERDDGVVHEGDITRRKGRKLRPDRFGRRGPQAPPEQTRMIPGSVDPLEKPRIDRPPTRLSLGAAQGLSVQPSEARSVAAKSLKKPSLSQPSDRAMKAAEKALSAGASAGQVVEAATRASAAVQADMAAEQALINKLVKQSEQLTAEKNEVAANVVKLQLELERAKLRKLTYQAKSLAQGAAAAAAGAKAEGQASLDDIMGAIRQVLANKVGGGNKPGSSQAGGGGKARKTTTATDSKVAALKAAANMAAASAKATDKAAKLAVHSKGGGAAPRKAGKKSLLEAALGADLAAQLEAENGGELQQQSEAEAGETESEGEEEDESMDTEAALEDLEALRGTSDSRLDRSQQRLHYKVQHVAEQEGKLSSDEKELDDILLRWSHGGGGGGGEARFASAKEDEAEDLLSEEETPASPAKARSQRVPLP